jgi:hypothetical protein
MPESSAVLSASRATGPASRGRSGRSYTLQLISVRTVIGMNKSRAVGTAARPVAYVARSIKRFALPSRSSRAS